MNLSTNLSTNLFQSVNHYCERLDSSFWSEPLNLFSNIFFIISAFYVQRIYTQRRLSNWSIKLQYKLVYLIGIGSALFHSFATNLAMIADVVPIAVFVLIYLWWWCYGPLKLGVKGSIAMLGLFAAMSFIFTVYLKEIPLNGSQGYLSVCTILIGLGCQQKLYRNEKPLLLYAGIIFTISLLFRSLDRTLCSYVAFGTHFIWHTLNAIVLLLAMLNAIASINQDSK